MSDTLDGMTVAQLDELIARAQATKKKVEEEAWVALPDSIEGYKLKVNRKTLEVHYKGGLTGWHNLPNTSEAVQLVCQKVGTSSDITNVARALLAIAKFTK